MDSSRKYNFLYIRVQLRTHKNLIEAKETYEDPPGGTVVNVARVLVAVVVRLAAIERQHADQLRRPLVRCGLHTFGGYRLGDGTHERRRRGGAVAAFTWGRRAGRERDGRLHVRVHRRRERVGPNVAQAAHERDHRSRRRARRCRLPAADALWLMRERLPVRLGGARERLLLRRLIQRLGMHCVQEVEDRRRGGRVLEKGARLCFEGRARHNQQIERCQFIDLIELLGQILI